MNNTDFITNIENCADEIANNYGYEAVKFVLQKYGASTLEDLKTSDYSSVFNELQGLSITV